MSCFCAKIILPKITKTLEKTAEKNFCSKEASSKLLMTLTPGQVAVVVNDDPATRGQGVIVHLDSSYGGSLSGQKDVIIRSILMNFLTFMLHYPTTPIFAMCLLHAVVFSKLKSQCETAKGF